MSEPDFQEMEIENLREELNNLQIQYRAANESRKQFEQLAARMGNKAARLEAALRMTHYILNNLPAAQNYPERIAANRILLAEFEKQ